MRDESLFRLRGQGPSRLSGGGLFRLRGEGLFRLGGEGLFRLRGEGLVRVRCEDFSRMRGDGLFSPEVRVHLHGEVRVYSGFTAARVSPSRSVLTKIISMLEKIWTSRLSIHKSLSLPQRACPPQHGKRGG